MIYELNLIDQTNGAVLPLSGRFKRIDALLYAMYRGLTRDKAISEKQWRAMSIFTRDVLKENQNLAFVNQGIEATVKKIE